MLQRWNLYLVRDVDWPDSCVAPCGKRRRVLQRTIICWASNTAKNCIAPTGGAKKYSRAGPWSLHCCRTAPFRSTVIPGRRRGFTPFRQDSKLPAVARAAHRASVHKSKSNRTCRNCQRKPAPPTHCLSVCSFLQSDSDRLHAKRVNCAGWRSEHVAASARERTPCASLVARCLSTGYVRNRA